MAIAKGEFADKASLVALVDTEAAELQRYVPETTARQYRETKLQALTKLATPQSTVKAFFKTAGITAAGGVIVAVAASEALGMGTSIGSALFKIGATTAILSPVFGLVAMAHVHNENQEQHRELLKEIIRSHRRTDQMRKGIVPELGLNT